MKVHFATSNKNKVENARAALQPFGIEVEQIEIDLIESRSEDPAVIALEKAKQAYLDLKKPVIVEDSGFFIEALGGFPMTHVKFSLKTVGMDGLMKMMRGVRNRRAEWRMTLAYVYGPGKFKSFTFIERGVIAKSLRPVKRTMMSDYWRVYVPTMLPGNVRALSEMTDADMANWMAYFGKHNQFKMFGQWYKRSAAKK